MELFDKKFVHFMWDAELEGKECFIADSIDELESRVNENDSAFLCRAQYSGCKSYPFYDDKYNWKFAYYDPNYALKIACHEERQIQCRRIGYENWVDTPKPCWDNKHWVYRIKPEIQFVCGLASGGADKFMCSTADDHSFKHVYVAFVDMVDALNWCTEHDKFAKVARAWEEGQEIEIKVLDTWYPCKYPNWDIDSEYRVKSTKRRMTNRELAKWLAEGNGQLKLRSGDKTTLYSYCGKDEAFITEGWTIREWNSDEWREPEVEE